MGKTSAKPGKTKSRVIQQRGKGIEVPSAAELGTTFLPRGGGSSADAEGSVMITLMHYCMEGSIYSTHFSSKPLMVAFLEHKAKPSVFYKIREIFEKFFAMKIEQDSDFPKGYKEVEQAYSMQLVTTGKRSEDESCDNIGFKEYCQVLFVDQDEVKNVMMLMDELVHWRAELADDNFNALPEVPKIVFYVPSDFEFTIDDTDEMECHFEIRKQVRDDISVFDTMPPVYPRRIVVANISLVNPTVVEIVFSGNTYPFRQFFEHQAIGGKQQDPLPGAKHGEYFRVIPSVDITKKDKEDWLVDVLGEKVLRNSPVVVRVNKSAHPLDALNPLLARLRSRANVRVE